MGKGRAHKSLLRGGVGSAGARQKLVRKVLNFFVSGGFMVDNEELFEPCRSFEFSKNIL